MSLTPDGPSPRERMDRLLAQACAARPRREDEVLADALAGEHLRTDQLVAYARQQLSGEFDGAQGEQASRQIEAHLLACRTCLEEFAAIELCVAAELRASRERGR